MRTIGAQVVCRRHSLSRELGSVRWRTQDMTVARMPENADKLIRILVIDDHSVFRAGLRMIIERTPHMTVVAEAANSQDALAAATQEQPDVILLDLDLGGENGLSLVSELREVAKQARIVVLTGLRDAEIHRRAVVLGALGVVRKEKAPEVLISAIGRVYAGEAWLDRTLIAEVITELSHTGAAPDTDPEQVKITSLTTREKQVIACLAEGLSTKELAERLFISDKTVGHHLGSIFDKLGVASRSELIVYAYRHQLVELPPKTHPNSS